MFYNLLCKIAKFHVHFNMCFDSITSTMIYSFRFTFFFVSLLVCFYFSYLQQITRISEEKTFGFRKVTFCLFLAKHAMQVDIGINARHFVNDVIFLLYLQFVQNDINLQNYIFFSFCSFLTQ